MAALGGLWGAARENDTDGTLRTGISVLSRTMGVSLTPLSAQPWEGRIRVGTLGRGHHQNGDTLASVFLSPEYDRLLLFELYLVSNTLSYEHRLIRQPTGEMASGWALEYHAGEG